MRSAFAVLAFASAVLLARSANAAGDASAGYETIKPSLVKVWAFDRSGHPVQCGTGVVVESNARRSLVLTASHVIAGAGEIRVDVNRARHDIAAHVERTGPRDLTLLSIDLGRLRAARFAPASHAVIEGNLVAVAGYVKNDELIGVVGQVPRVLFPGTVAARPDNGNYLELENVHVEEGLSGGAVFDPETGDVVGIVTARTSDRRGGFADSGTRVVVPFLQANHIAAVDVPLPRPPPLDVALLTSQVPTAVATLQAAVTLARQRDPAPAPGVLPGAVISWQESGETPKRFVYSRRGCRIAVTVDVRTLRFVVAHQALVQPRHRGALLGITVQRRAPSDDACAGIGDSAPAAAAYDPIAMSFDGHHVTMRFVYAGGGEAGDAFPSDASLDADLGAGGALATVSFFERDWTGSIQVPLVQTASATVSRTW